MMRVAVRLGLAVACTAILSALAAQQASVPALNVPGIEGTNILQVVQDREGALWLGTDRGLLRFDGAAVEAYHSDPADPAAMPADHVYHLTVGSDGALWASTPGGPYRLDAVTGMRGLVPAYSSEGARRDLECLATAPSRRGHWAFMGTHGVHFLAHGDPVFRPIARGGRPVDRAAGGWEAPDGRLWYCDRNSIRLYDPATGSEREFPCRIFSDVQDHAVLLTGLYPDAHDPNSLWCTSWGSGFIHFDRTTGLFRPYLLRTPLNGRWNIVRSALQLDAKRWLLSVDDSLKVFDGANIAPAPSPVRANGLCRTRAGDVVIGAYQELRILPSERQGMQLLQGELAKGALSAAPAAYADGFWAVRYYAERALVHTDGQGQVRHRIAFPPEQPQPEPFLVRASRHPAPRGTIWVASTRGLWRHLPGSAILERVPLAVPGLANDRPWVLDLLEDDEGRLWLNCAPGTIVRYDPRTGTTEPVSLPPALREARFRSLAPVGASGLVAVRSRGHPVLIDTRDLSAAELPIAGAQPGELNGLLSAVATPDHDMVLLASAGRLIRLRQPAKAGDAWSADRRWRLPDRPTFQTAVADPRGRVWITSDRNTYLLDPSSGVLHELDEAHGAPCSGMETAVLLPDGGMLLSGAGAMRFDPSFEPHADTARLSIRQVRVNGLERTASLATEGLLRLPHHQNDLSIAFSCVALLEGDVFRFAYRLARDGDTSAWVSLDRQRTLNLSGLRPGTYAVLIAAEGQGHPPQQAALHFIIDPPWWAAWWARSAWFALITVAVIAATRQVLLVRYRRRLREVERERELERVRMRIARDIHDGIGSGLTKITMLARQLQAQDDRAARIVNASVELVNDLSDILWTVDPRNDSFASFIARVRSTLSKQTEHSSVQVVSDLRCAPSDRECSLGPELKHHVLLVLIEAVNNALKHSHCTRIEVQLELNRTAACLRVADDGRGFDPAQVRDGANGLINFRKRAEAIGGTVDVATGPTGTSVVLRAPIPSTNM